METHKLILTDQHEYFLGDRKIDGLTASIKEAGLIRGGGESYMTRGTAIHLATQFYDKGSLDESTVDSQIHGYLESWKRFRQDQNFTPSHVEWAIYHPEIMVAMTIDRLPGPLDIKSGAPEPWHVLQIAAQWSALLSHGLRDFVKSPMDVYLDPDGGPPKIKLYNIAELKEAYQVYSSMLYFLRWKRR